MIEHFYRVEGDDFALRTKAPSPNVAASRLSRRLSISPGTILSVWDKQGYIRQYEVGKTSNILFPLGIRKEPNDT